MPVNLLLRMYRHSPSVTDITIYMILLVNSRWPFTYFCATSLFPNIYSLHTFGCLHCSDVTMSAMVSQITGVSIVCSTVCSGADQRKHQSSALVAFVNPPLTDGVPSQRASNAKNVSIWWRHHVNIAIFSIQFGNECQTTYSSDVYVECRVKVNVGSSLMSPDCCSLMMSEIIQ